MWEHQLLRRFGKRPIAPSEAEREAAAVDLDRIQRGGIPLGAEQRLTAVAATGSPVFSSDLSAKEYAIARRKGGDHTLAALQSIRAARPGGYRLFVILDNLSANKTPAIRSWAGRANIELCFTPTSASWANPIEAQFGPLRTFVMGDSDHPNHAVLARRLQNYLRWRNANARHPDILAAQRKERARIRSERHHRWGRPRQRAA